MADESKKNNPNTSKQLVERPVDTLYYNGINYITMSFENLPNLDSVNTESWKTFLADTWDQHFPETDNILDFLKYLIYYTGLIGKFYKINCSLSLDDAFFLLKDRLPNPDMSFKTWHKLHKVVGKILMDQCKEMPSDVSLILDLHTSTDSACDNSGHKVELLNFDDLSDEHESVLVFHITVNYGSKDKSFLTCFKYPPNNISNPNINRNNKDFYNKSNISMKSEPIVFSEQSDLFSKSLSKSNNIDQWEKYGARPKTKRHYQTNCIKNETNTRNEKENEIIDSYKTSDKDMCPRILREGDQVQTHSRLSTAFERINKMIQDGGCLSELNSTIKESNDLSLLPCPNTENTNRTIQNEYFERLLDTAVVPNTIPSTSASVFPSPFIPPTSEDKSFYTNYDVKEIWVRRKSYCETNGNKGFKTVNLPEKGTSGYIPGLEGVFASERELEEMPENMREVQKKYEEAVLSLMESEATCEFKASSANNKDSLVRYLRDEYLISEEKQAASLQLPSITFQTANAEQDASANVKNLYNFGTTIGLQVRESILRYELKTFFENYKFISTENGRSLSNSVGEYCSIYSPINLDPTLFTDSNSWREKETISHTNDMANELFYGDSNTGRLAIETFEDKISFNWEIFSDKNESSSGNPNTSVQQISRKNVQETSENNKIFVIDGEPMPPETSDEVYDKFFQNFVEKLTESPAAEQKFSPQRTENSQSTYEKHSTQEELLKYFEVKKKVRFEKRDKIKSEDSSDDDLAYNCQVPKEFLDVSDYDSSPEKKSATEAEE